MAVQLPNIDIKFSQLANTFIQRSERGVAIIVIKDDTRKGGFTYKKYKEITDLEDEKAEYETANYQYLHDVMEFGVAELNVVRIDKTGEDSAPTFEDGLKLVAKKFKTGWVSFVSDEQADYEALVSWIKKQNDVNKLTFRAITYGLTGIKAPDHEAIVNFVNPTVTFVDTTRGVEGVCEAYEYIPSLMGIFASCNVLRGVTYYICKNLKEVEEVADNNGALDKGQFILINDFDEVRIGLSINSLTTFGKENGKFEDMRFIDIMEVIYMITDDIRDVFKNDFIGLMKNNLDNQMLFVSAINNYFDKLADDDILDNLYVNVASINVESQKKAWINAGVEEAKTWDEAKVKNMAFKRTIFLTGDIKVNGAIENLAFDIHVN